MFQIDLFPALHTYPALSNLEATIVLIYFSILASLKIITGSLPPNSITAFFLYFPQREPITPPT